VDPSLLILLGFTGTASCLLACGCMYSEEGGGSSGILCRLAGKCAAGRGA
jgi:hypothetical protein